MSDQQSGTIDLDAERFARKTLQNLRGSQPSVFEVAEILRLHPQWRGVLAYERMLDCVVKRHPGPITFSQEDEFPSPWLDLDTIKTEEWFCKVAQCQVSISVLDRAVNLVANESRYSEIEILLDSYSWDKIHRIDTWLIDYFGVDDDIYSRSIASKWLISAVARAFEPGCKVDYVLVLSGKGGMAKSSAFKILGGRFYSCNRIDIRSSFRSLSMAGTWIQEIQELDAAMKGNDAEVYRSWITESNDDYVPKHSNRKIYKKRCCVIGATVNPQEWLESVYGGDRRMWPITVKRELDQIEFKKVINQLWAEAVVRYRAGEKWYITDEEEKEMSLAMRINACRIDPWEQTISEWIVSEWSTVIQKVGYITVSQVMIQALKINISSQTEQHAKRIRLTLEGMGWVKGDMVSSSGIGRYHPWYPPAAKFSDVPLSEAINQPIKKSQ